jgi:hypothetical protein
VPEFVVAPTKYPKPRTAGTIIFIIIMALSLGMLAINHLDLSPESPTQRRAREAQARVEARKAEQYRGTSREARKLRDLERRVEGLERGADSASRSPTWQPSPWQPSWRGELRCKRSHIDSTALDCEPR